jgi:UDP-N-acetylglucosamine acyltransferase
VTASIHPTAVIASDAVISDDVDIGPYAVIGAGVEIGSGTRIGPHAVIHGPTRIGANNRIFQFASVGDAPQDKKYRGEPTRLEIGDNNIVRECVTLNRGTTKDAGVTRIGNDNLFMAYSHVAHDCVIGDHCVFANSVALGGHVHIGDWVIMAGFSGVHQFCKVGAHAFIANNAAVTRDVPPYVMTVGQPATAHSINSEGLKRRGFTAEQIRNLRNAFRVLYRSGLKLADAERELKALAAGQPEVAAFVEFLSQSTRSIVR